LQRPGKSRPDLLTVKEYHSLLQLLCPDFPMDLAQKAARIVLMDDAMDCLMSFADFLYAFQVQFYYCEFLESLAVIYQDLSSGKTPNTVIVPTSSSMQPRARPATSDCPVQEGVEAGQFYECIESLGERCRHRCVFKLLLKKRIGDVERETIMNLLLFFKRPKGLSHREGALPNKTSLLVDPKMDQELEKLIAQIPLNQIIGTNSGRTGRMVTKEPGRMSSSRKARHHRRRRGGDMGSDGSNVETDSSEN
uniref:Centriolar satellite-associated tubulin polyglutamylase complex regulator 1 n=1 Tax=Latimeria chalumnae TaxID=7897 RepID=H3BHX0_LATCH